MTNSNQPPRRPSSVTLLVLGVLSIAAIHFLRFALAIQQWAFLSHILYISPLYLASNGLIWGLIWLLLGLGLWLGRKRAARFTPFIALAYTLYYWFDRLVLSVNARGANWSFALITNILLLVLIFWILTRRKAKAFFGVLNER